MSSQRISRSETSETSSSLAREKLNISQLKDALKDELISILDTVQGSKALVLDKDLAGPISLIADFSILKEHGVEKVSLLEDAAPNTEAVRGIVYFTLPNVRNMKLIAGHIRALSSAVRNERVNKDISIQLVPRRTLLCERVLEEEGVLGEIVLGEYQMGFIPLEDDLLSLELPATFKELYLDGDFSSIYHTAQALMQIQGVYGLFPRIVGKGDYAHMLGVTLERMRREMLSTSSSGVRTSTLAASSVFDSLVIIDRAVDMVTPLLTQLTYEGFIDEVYGIQSGAIVLGSSTDSSQQQVAGSSSTTGLKKKRVLLNSTDPVYKEIRDMNFSQVGSLLSRMSRQLQDIYESRHKAKTVQEIRGFVGKLGELQAEHQSLKSHVSLAEMLLAHTQSDDFSTILDIEQTLVSGDELTIDQFAYLDKILALGDSHIGLTQLTGQVTGQSSAGAPHSIYKALRILCLYSLWRGPNFKQRTYEMWYDEIISAFGHHHIITLDNLSKVGLFTPPANQKALSTSKGASEVSIAHRSGISLDSFTPSTRPHAPAHQNRFSFLRKTLDLVVSDIRENDPDDISYVYSGYAPLSIRLLQCLVHDPAVYAPRSSGRYSLFSLTGNNSSRNDTRDNGQGVGGVQGGWQGWDDVLAEVAGHNVDIVQTGNDQDVGLSFAGSIARRRGEKHPATLVLFLGGCTFTEVAALRLLSRMHNHNYIAATTQILNGNTFLDSLIQDK